MYKLVFPIIRFDNGYNQTNVIKICEYPKLLPDSGCPEGLFHELEIYDPEFEFLGVPLALELE